MRQIKCLAQIVGIPPRHFRVRADQGRWVVFALDHTPRRWYRWAAFDSQREAATWCRGKFPVSCGVRIIYIANGAAQTTANPFPKASPCLVDFVEFQPGAVHGAMAR